MMKINANERICPECGTKYQDYPSISRVDNTTEICPMCGQKQAISQFAMLTAETYQTRDIAEWAKENPQALEFIISSFERHLHLDWGEMDEEDVQTNNHALVNGSRLFSSYNIPTGLCDNISDDKIWIITEADRSTNTILFPSEY